MSKFDNLNIGDTIYVTGIEANLYKCHDDDYKTLLSVVNEECKVVDVSDNVELYYLPDVGERCIAANQRGVLIQSPKLQGHDGGGRCPESNCYWIGKDYLSFESMSIDDTMAIFDKINESEENIKEISHNDLEFGMTVIVDGYDVNEKTQKWENKIGTVVYDYNEDEDDTSNSFTVSFKDWANGHDGSNLAECGHNKCWSFYDDCAYSEEYNCQNIDGVKFYTVNTYDLFDQINESEEDEFDWAKETINQEYNRYEDILPYLDYADIISITGDITSDEGEVLLSAEDEPFKVFSTSHPMRKNKTVYLKWVQSEDKRPENWEEITNDSDEVHMGDSTFEWDKKLMVKFLKFRT